MATFGRRRVLRSAKDVPMRSSVTVEDDDECEELRRRQRADDVRRAQLYGIAAKKRLPKVRTQPQDARTRKELQLLMMTPQPETATLHGLSVVEEELERRKHHEHLGIRPALDQSHPLRDLFTTVPRRVDVGDDEKPESTAARSREWRLGYKNEPQSDFHGAALRGIFEPSDVARERLVETTASYRESSIATAYQPPCKTHEQVVKDLEPYDQEKVRKDMDAKLRVESQSATSPAKRHWTPASSATREVREPKKRTKKAAEAMKITQHYPIREAASPLEKTPLRTDPRLLRKQLAQANKTNERYAEIQRRDSRRKDPTARYALPIENPKFERSYRLGLDPVPSTPDSLEPGPELADSECPVESPPTIGKAKRKTAKSSKPPVLFRPKSAVTLRMETAMTQGSSLLAKSSSSASLLTRTDSVGKVAGAKRRPHSATLAYLSNSTIYCMNNSATAPTHPQDYLSDGLASNHTDDFTPPPYAANAVEVIQQQKKYGISFHGAIMEERARRHEFQQERIFDLARRGILRSIPVPQIFARLRREALKNLTKRVEYARYEKLSLEEYMSICGMAVLAEASRPRYEEVHANLRGSDEEDGDDDKDQFPGPEMVPATEAEDPVIQALRDEVELRQLPFDGPASSVFRKRKAIRPDPADGNNSSTVQAMRKALFVTREQFHIALEPFALHARDVNLLFSALDLNVDDNVPIWEIVCVVEQLQGGHQEIRRSRVRIKARLLPKELATLRRSVSFPHQTHVLLPVSSPP